MRKKRCLTQDAWYEVRTAINNREPLFSRQQAVKVFCRVFGEAHGRFAFELRGFRLDGERLSFYIKPTDGMQLPAIMQWVKQTFAVRFNLSEDRTGHVWGDRYWSRVVEGEPPEEAVEVDWEAVEAAAKTGVISFGACPPDGVSPLTGETPAETGFSPPNPGPDPRGIADTTTSRTAAKQRPRARSARPLTPHATGPRRYALTQQASHGPSASTHRRGQAPTNSVV